MSRILSSVILLLMVVAVAWWVNLMDASVQPAQAAGLEVYLGEGCIQCHSQYRRPVGRDMELWGPATNAEQALSGQHPVLFGNRRQGPDLSNVGLRRSREWNRAHLINPRAVRPGSRMPSYAHLFKTGDPRGEALLDYLQGRGTDEREDWQAHVSQWTPVPGLPDGRVESGKLLYRELCATCHGESGDGAGAIAGIFTVAPRDLRQPQAWQWAKSDKLDRDLELARLIKYGRPGTSMAGTEWLRGQELADLIRFLETLQQDESR